MTDTIEGNFQARPAPLGSSAVAYVVVAILACVLVNNEYMYCWNTLYPSIFAVYLVTRFAICANFFIKIVILMRNC